MLVGNLIRCTTIHVYNTHGRHRHPTRRDIKEHDAGRLEPCPSSPLERHHEVNCSSIKHSFTFISVTKSAWPHMREQQFGRIVNVTSASGLYGNIGQANYAAAKMGIAGFTFTAAKEGIRSNIKVNVVAPLAMSRMTETIESASPKVLGRLQPDFVAPFVGYLCHDDCAVSGNIYEVGAGWVSRVRWQRSKGVVFPPNGGMTLETIAANLDSIHLPLATVAQLVDDNKKDPNDQINVDVVQAEELLQVVSILESETSEAAQKRQILKLFEWFKAQYAQLTGTLRSSVHREQALMAKDLREKVICLEGQVKELQRQPPCPEKNNRLGPSKSSPASNAYMEVDISTFNEWKAVNKVWSPSKSTAKSTNDLYWNNTPSTLSDSRSTFGFPVTPMERAMTAAPSLTRKQPESGNSRSHHNRLPTV
ncbi:hypothetical protein DYB37_003026 [Aphanomyces astaci]|uniref:Uncharacterized protein n=1 Tax=Aphanomyces astaci TaxID=112090 RepID=A0A397BB97_APHAT|nr:hypothetical protein DYB25_007680 [Aphanomyces astaci]RHY40959.1 hypothetical protein DYB30_001416 [Aphanomyces astaci]RHY85485.1 hypothetical protein DYB35_001932 [Aphanomyces astaci]RHZ11151.1 hypothetical protein DYB26_000026 [Aphanomyces astaci]RHZ24873.1 hypothetical protein DYB37_003026 [Aphanomyces astaci]